MQEWRYRSTHYQLCCRLMWTRQEISQKLYLCLNQHLIMKKIGSEGEVSRILTLNVRFS